MHHSLASTLEHLSSFQLFVIILGHWFLSLWLYQAEFLKIDLLGERVWFFFFQSLDIDCQSPFRNLVLIYTSTSCLCEHRLYWTQSSSDVTSRCQNSFSSFGSKINIQDNHSESWQEKMIVTLWKHFFSILREESRIGRY